MVEIRPCSFDDLDASAEFPALLAQYAAESSHPELGAPCAQIETYRAMERTGMLHVIGAFAADQLAGFLLITVVVLPHYGVLAATAESFFVAPEYRKSGAGLRLLAAGEALARGLGARAMLVSAPVGGALSRVMSARRSYRLSNEVFVKALA
jgi:GNAT superfamily N-acetyltransferase